MSRFRPANPLRAAFLVTFACLLAGAAAGAGSEAPKTWHFLPATEVGADAFRAAHPAWDGRGALA